MARGYSGTYNDDLRLRAISAMLRAAETLTLQAADEKRSGHVETPYLVGKWGRMREDARLLREFAQLSCPHLDDDYESADKSDDCLAHCSLCEKTWLAGEGRDA